MEANILEGLLDVGGLAALAAFLVVQFNKAQTRLDEAVDGFRKTIERLAGEQAAEQEKIRDRYGAVVARYEERLDQCHKEVVDRLKEQGRILETLDEGNRSSVFDPSVTLREP